MEGAKSSILAAQAKQKQLYDEKHSKPDCFPDGQQVLKKDFTRRKQNGGKLDHRFLGPFVIKQQLSWSVYLLNQDGKDVKVTGAHLKPYVHQWRIVFPWHLRIKTWLQVGTTALTVEMLFFFFHNLHV